MKEHDTIKLLSSGKEGTIVHIYPDGKTFEIEFNDNGAITVKTITLQQIMGLRAWKEYCPRCKKKHIMTMQPCPECGVYHTPQPRSEIVAANCYADNACDGCQAYRDHLR